MADTHKTDDAAKGLGSQQQAGVAPPESDDQIAKKGAETAHIEEEGEPLGANFA